MDGLEKDIATELLEKQIPTNQTLVEAGDTFKCVSQPKANDDMMDMFPGTSHNCMRSISKSKDANYCGETAGKDLISLPSIESLVCRICHNSENTERLVSPCLCKGSLSYVHIYCLERWIGMSRCTTCELCQFQYNTEQTLRYTFYQSLRIWYSRSMSRRALQEDCQMLLLLTLIAFGIVGTLLVAVQFYILQGHINGLGRIWTKGWLIFFLAVTLIVYIINAYMIVRAQLLPWYRWWQTARDIQLVLENHNLPYNAPLRKIKTDEIANSCIAAVQEESACQTAEGNCSQHDTETAIKCDGPPQRRQQEVGATGQNIKRSFKMFSSLDNSNGTNRAEIMKDDTSNKLQFQLLANNGDVELGNALHKHFPPEHPFDCLVQTV